MKASAGTWEKALRLAVEAAREVHPLVVQELHRAGGRRGGGHHTDIDREVELVVRERLLTALPWRYRGEETGVHEGTAGDPVWVVDPNDGTKSFLLGMRGSALSIAAVHEGVPILGVILAFGYPDDDGDLVAWGRTGWVASTQRQVRRDSARGRVADAREHRSRLARCRQDPEANLECCAPARFRA